MPYTYAQTVVHAIEEGRGELARGYTFTGPDGKEDFYSFDRLRAEAMKRARHLRRLGLRKGDRMAMVIPDGADFVPTFFGALWAGIIPVPLYPPLSLGKLDSYLDSLVNIMGKAEPKALCTTKRVQQILWSVVGKLPSLQQVVLAEDLAQEPEVAEPFEPVTPEDTAFLQFTSGSTSAPKGVVVTHASLRANAWGIMVDGLNADESDVGVSWLPLYHDMGLIGFVLAPMFHKTPVVFLPTLSFVKSATLWMDTLHKKRGTITFAPNFAYALVTKRAKPEMLARWDLSCVKAFGCGAEPINPGTMRAFLDTFSKAKLRPQALLPCYGMAEATLAITFIPMDEQLKTDTIDADTYQAHSRASAVKSPKQGQKTLELVCCGKPFPGHEVAIFDDRDRPLPERQIGQVVVRGPSVAAGYYRDPDATQRTLAGGWLHTGDLGYLAGGELYIAGRQKDLIIVNGRNYDPQRIEWLVDELPGVRKGSAVAFSRPGPSSEELVVVAESREKDLAALTETLRQRVNEQMQLVVADVVLVPPGSLPKTSSGKLQRQKTRAQYLASTLGTEGVRTMGGTAQRLMLAKHFTLSLVGRGRHVARGLMRVTLARVTDTQTVAGRSLVGRTVARLLNPPAPQDRN